MKLSLSDLEEGGGAFVCKIYLLIQMQSGNARVSSVKACPGSAFAPVSALRNAAMRLPAAGWLIFFFFFFFALLE